MARGNNIQEILGMILTIVVFFIVGGAIVNSMGSAGNNVGLEGIITFVFVIGGIAIIGGLLAKIFNLFR